MNIKPGLRYVSGNPDNATVIVVTSEDAGTVRFVTVGYLVGPEENPVRMDPARGEMVICRLSREVFEGTHASNCAELRHKIANTK